MMDRVEDQAKALIKLLLLILIMMKKQGRRVIVKRSLRFTSFMMAHLLLL
jgi:hypothetical protein